MLFRRPAKPEQMKIIVVGAGEVGFYVAQRLAEEHKQVVVIDQNPEKLRRIEEHMDVRTVLGSGANPSVLHKADASDASIFLAVTDSDEINIVACLFANAIAPKAAKLARIRSPEYSSYTKILDDCALNISMLVNPEVETVRTIERLLTLPGAVESGEFADGRIRMVGMRMKTGPLIGRPLREFRTIINDDGIMVGAIDRKSKLIVPSGSDCIQEGDVVYFIYRLDSQHYLLRAVERTQGILSSACIVGGGNTGFRLANVLKAKGVAVKLIDHNPKRCETLADLLDDVLVLHGDGTDKSLLEEEHVEGMDAFIAVTGDEETNILSCMLAKTMGVRQTVVKVNKAAYLQILNAIGIDHSVSPRHSAVNSILHYIRQGKVLSSVSVGGEAAEILEALVPSHSVMSNQTIQGLGLPRGVLFLSVVRGKEAFIPSGQTVLMEDDRIILLSTREHMNVVETMLSEKK